MERLLTVSTLLSAGLILVILHSLRRSHIRVEYSVSWLAAGFAVLLLSRWEGALEWLGATLGISYPPAVLLGILIGIFLFVLYRISMIVSTLRDNNIALAQKVAILEFELKHLQANREAAPNQ